MIESKTKVGEIERYFESYPDVPREVILKADIVRLGQRFSDNALECTTGAMVKTYHLFSYDLMPMESMGRQEYLKAPGQFTISQGPYNLRPVTVQTTLADDSPYVVDVIQGRLWLCADGIPVAHVCFPRAPAYYTKFFEDGTAYREIIANGFFITVFRFCQFWGIHEECRFCDLNTNARQMKAVRSYTVTGPVKDVNKVAEVANEVGREAVKEWGYPPTLYFIISGGTIIDRLHGKAEDDFYLEYVEAVKWGGPRRYVALQTNAKDKETLRRYRACGLDCFDANMEVWDKKLFQWICPGKARRVGWEEWVRRIVDSVDVFGEGNVQPNFVCGVEMAQPYGFQSVEEAVKSTTEGIEFLMSHGVVPRFNQWRREPMSYLVREQAQPPVPLDFYIQLMRNYYEIWKKYRLPMPHRFGAYPADRVLGRGHGTYDDYIILMEQRDYVVQASEALQRGRAIWGREAVELM